MVAAAPPPLHSLSAPLRTGSRASLVLLRNAVPVVGVYALGWSAEAAS